MSLYLPWRGWWSTPFARWQGTLASQHSIELAARVAAARLPVEAASLDWLAYGQTVMQPGSLYAGPWFAAMVGAGHLPAQTASQACATGARLLAAAMGAAATGELGLGLIASGDRTSNGPHIYYPAPEAPGGTGVSEDWVIGNFARDPWAGGSMLDTAEAVAAREGIDTAEQHAVVERRQAQYAEALEGDRAFQRPWMAPVEVLDARGRVRGALEADEGVQAPDPAKVARLRPVLDGGTVTHAGQTHPADGAAGMLVCADRGRARELGEAAGGGPLVEVLSTGSGRAEKGCMPAAPIHASRDALARAGLGIGDVDVIKSHDPFAVNDIAFARAFGIAWESMNPMGCSLIWGHPQGPTGLRAMVEMVEVLAARGGGTGLFHGCAAGDSGMAAVIRVG